MKLKSINSILAKSVAVLAACASLNATAGTAPAPAPAPEPSSLFDSIGATLDVAYDSRYYFRGLWFADNIITTALGVSVPLVGGGQEDGGSLTLGFGAAYISTVQTPFGNPVSNSAFDYSEIDLWTNLVYDAGFAKFGVQYQYYMYPDTYAGSFNGVGNGANDPEFGITGAGEVGFTVAIPLGAANIYAGYYHDFRIAGQYLQLGADYTFAVNDWLSIVPSVQTGYGFDYYTGNNNAFSQTAGALTGNNLQPLGPTSGFTHLLVSVAAPIKVTKSATLTPYVAWNHSFDLRTALNLTEHNEVFWGAKLSLAF
ncbi:MAG: hypothetical protein JNG86_16085 [Verrucomicrobiaceae bacterium]|nr:hypothetical protein [Verrucomicrobiaceae bacterium]